MIFREIRRFNIIFLFIHSIKIGVRAKENILAEQYRVNLTLSICIIVRKIINQFYIESHVSFHFITQLRHSHNSGFSS